MSDVAVIGAGPSGLVAARWLKEVGFEPVLYEQCDSIGGQWSGDPRVSGVWPSMRTNTSRVVTVFGDLPHEPGTPAYPTNQAMLAYLRRYAQRFGLMRRVRMSTRVTSLDRGADGRWIVASVDAEGREERASYERVLVASGRFQAPRIPAVPGLASFAGTAGVVHTFAYKDPERYRGRRVLLAGCAISALEIACDLAMLGAARVVCTNRRQHYVLPKMVAGVPLDCVLHTRFAAIGYERLPHALASAELKRFIDTFCGRPEQFGAPPVPDDPLVAGTTLCQHFLPLVAEARIDVKPWIARIDDRTVHFDDGSSDEFDAILFGTGFDVHLPFLAASIRETLNLDRDQFDLYLYSFHHALPGLAFTGMWQVRGPYWPSLELNARWIAHVWGGLRPAPTADEMRSGIDAQRAQGGASFVHRMPVLTMALARAAGVEPALAAWPQLAGALLFGPLSEASFRLHGPFARDDAADGVGLAASDFGHLRTAALSAEQRVRLSELAAWIEDPELSALCQG